jgi:DNA-binding SARP family transcriptional activator
MGRGGNPGETAKDPAHWRIAGELLDAGQYAQVADIFYQAQVSSEQAGDQVLAHVLAMACRICLACSQCRVEVEWYHRAYAEADRREQELRQQLHAILDLFGGIESSKSRKALSTVLNTGLEQPRRDIAQPAGRPGLWQRIRNIFRRKSPLQPPKPGIPALAIAGSDLTLIEKGRAPAAFLPMPGGELTVVEVPPIPPAPAPELDPTIETTEHLIAQQAEEANDPLSMFEKEELEPSLVEQVEVPPVPLAPEPDPAIETKERFSAQQPDVSMDSLSEIEKEEWSAQPLPSLVAYCLGAFRVYQNDQFVTDWDSLKARSILKYLLARGGRPVAKDILMDLFWPDAAPESARRNLHQAIYSLRQTLKRGRPAFQHIQFANDCYRINPKLDIWIDCQEFEAHVLAGRRLEAAEQPEQAAAEYGIAEALYQGDFLEEDLYEDWPGAQRERFRRMYRELADRLSEYSLRQGAHHAAIALCQKLLGQDNCHEKAHRRLMRCYLAQGQRHLAVRQYQICVQALEEELDLPPSEETVALYRRITSA